MDLPNRHWIPDGVIGFVATLNKFNASFPEDDDVAYVTRSFEAFLSLARRHDIYTKGGNDRMGAEFARFETLLRESFSPEEKTWLLCAESTRRFVKTPPVFDEAAMQRFRRMGEGVRRDVRSNPFKLFNDFKAVCSRYRPEDDPARPFELLCSVLYLVGKNLTRVESLRRYDPHKEVRDLATAELARHVFSDFTDEYFFGSGSLRIVNLGRLEASPVLGRDVTYVDAEVTGIFTQVGTNESFTYDADEPVQTRPVAILPRAFDLRLVDHEVDRLLSPRFRRQLVPISIGGVEMMAYVYSAVHEADG